MPTLEGYIAATPACPNPECAESLWWVHHAERWVCPHEGAVYMPQGVSVPLSAA